MDAADRDVTVVPLPELPPRQVVAVWHRERQLSEAARVETAVEVCAERRAA